jgi:GAF domain-containing protein
LPNLADIWWIVALVIVVVAVFVMFRWGGAVRSKLHLGQLLGWEVEKEGAVGQVLGPPGAPITAEQTAAAVPLPPPEPPADPQARQLLYAMERMADVGQALVRTIEEPDPSTAEKLILGWFQLLVRNLCMALTVSGRAETFRVALWADTEEELTGLAYHLFESGKPPEKLNRETSVAGHALRIREPYYVRNTETDPIYRPNTPGRRHSYRSIFAQPLGRDQNQWGVITVDARQPNGFTDIDQAIIAAFGKLATAGASLWRVLQAEKEADQAGRNPAA